MNLLDHYQNAIILKEDKIKILKSQVERAEEQAKQRNPLASLDSRRTSRKTSVVSGLMPARTNVYQMKNNSVLSEEPEDSESVTLEVSNTSSMRSTRPSLSDSHRTSVSKRRGSIAVKEGIPTENEADSHQMSASKRRGSIAVKEVMMTENEDNEPVIKKSGLQMKLDETKSKYEKYLEEERTFHQARIQIELIEHDRIKTVYKERFHEDLQDCSSHIRGINLMSESRSVLAHVQNIFPINLRNGMSYMGVQCDLDGLGELTLLKSIP